jgi:DNA segregation ATPase FtsK/SpoIIIE, S-DNA-T family
MAKKVNTKKSKAEDKDQFKTENETGVEVKQLLKDERTHKIAGTICLLIAFLLFIAFTSYLFTWEDDQDEVMTAGNKLFWGSEAQVSNLLGTLGAFLSHFFIYRGFGVASFFICSFFFVMGVNLFFGKRIFSVSKNVKYMLLGLVILSVAFAEIFAGKIFPWGGAVGNMARDWLNHTIGHVGTLAVLLVAVLSYVIWRFNPAFNLPAKKTIVPATADENIAAINTPNAATTQIEELEEEDEEEEELTPNTGTLSPITHIPFEVNAGHTQPLEITEKEIAETPAANEAALFITTPNTPKTKTVAEPLELEIKTALPEEEEELPTKNRAVASRQTVDTAYDPVLDLRDYQYPTTDLLETHGSEKIVQDAAELQANKDQIINTLKNYDISIQKISATVGPTVTLYEIIPAAGIRISKIKNLEDDIALSLAALGIRIIAPIPGKGTIGIEVPNVKKTIVSMKTLLGAEKFQHNNFSLPIAIGKRIDNENFIVDLASMPHLLMAGATGQGKSVGLNAILVSLLFKKHPSQLKFVLVDPKKVELSIYKTIERHFLAKLPGEEEAIITDTKKVVHTLNALCIEMDNRYDLLKEAGCRNIREYNEKFAARKLNPEKGHQFLPFIVLVVDEFADLIMTAGKEVELPIARLAQLARAVGIHLIIATQRPSVNIITGTIKANFPARIAFKVSSKIDSRTILDIGGAEQLIGKGDMLISYNGELVRLQCAFVDTPEVDKVNEFIGTQRGYAQAFMLPEYVDEKEMEKGDFDINDKDPLFEDAARLIVASQSGSTSLLQRKMKLGYNRAGRLMDQLEAAGVVGPNQGSKVRDVLIKTEADLMQLMGTF